MICNIIFDIGNVLTDFRWKDFLREKGFSETMVDRIGAATVENPIWKEYDRGVWSDDELINAFIANDPEIERELHQAFDDIRGIVKIREYAIPWLKELKENGYRVWYLSNFSEKAEKDCADSLAFLPYMDGGILSYREKLVKPDPAIYRLLLERYGLKAEECVFLDDTPVNVKAAQAFGISGIVFESPEQAAGSLRQLGVRTDMAFC